MPHNKLKETAAALVKAQEYRRQATQWQNGIKDGELEWMHALSVFQRECTPEAVLDLIEKVEAKELRSLAIARPGETVFVRFLEPASMETIDEVLHQVAKLNEVSEVRVIVLDHSLALATPPEA